MSSSDREAMFTHINNAMQTVHQSVGLHLRSQHPKGHVVLAAEFQTLEVPAELRHGLFTAPGTFPAVVRLSNGQHPDDNLPDARGCAIKVKLDPAGQAAAEQDFVLADSPVFFAKDAADFLRFLALKRQHTLEQRQAELDFSDPLVVKPNANAENALKAVKQRQMAEAIAAGQFPALARFAASPTRSLLELTWHSQTPYRLGPHVVKYVLQPSAENAVATPLDKTDDQYRHAIESFFAAGNTARFTLGVIVQTDATAMPIEDATVPWQGPVVPVAQLLIQPQAIDTAATRAAEARLAFAPHQALPEHAPVGSLNEARHQVYIHSRGTRHANAQTIRRYFGFLASGDFTGMSSCLHDSVEFEDLGFHLIGKTAVSLMWQILCLKKGGIRISVRNATATDTTGHAEWECQYDFLAEPGDPPRPIHNKIESTFQFDRQSGLIIKQNDQCDFWGWFEQAMGAKGKALHLVDKIEDATIAPIGVEEIARRKVRAAGIAIMRSVLEGKSR